MEPELQCTARKFVALLINYRNLHDGYYPQSNWLAPMAQRDGGSPWEDLAVEKADVDRALKLLTHRQREVLVRYVVLGQTQEQIGRELGIAQQVVSQHLAAAIKRAATILGPAW